MTPQEKSQLFEKIDSKSIPLDKWHINFSNLAPDTEQVYDTPEDAFLSAAQQYISGAFTRRQPEEGKLREFTTRIILCLLRILRKPYWIKIFILNSL